MKKNIKYALIAAGVGIVLAAGFLMANKATALNVNDVASDPAAFSGTITITGVVAGVSKQDPSIIGMMDKKELQCTTPGCKKFYLPFKAQAYSPAPGDEVRATGRFETYAAGYIFVADSVTVVKNHKIGG
ncbi:MAG: hypothetical protein A2010_09245 [Nitrospirae bacterium GWD2_57_9]|nr:MAG: hypothetical protein A2010_09245 [Nitrospirae bacterium GWD2_57_9]OGW46345.1 MAG: hypothetical protein A2078_01600 [Nitrospirae bacterium GWC2_57_9]